MHVLRLAGILVLGLVLAIGCRPKRQPAPPAPSPLEMARTRAEALRESYRAIDPKARVGMVISTRADFSLAAVGDVPISDFRVGDAISFIGSGEQANAQAMAHGTVTQIDTAANLLIVRYEIAPSNGRAPQAGDLAVRFGT